LKNLWTFLPRAGALIQYAELGTGTQLVSVGVSGNPNRSPDELFIIQLNFTLSSSYEWMFKAKIKDTGTLDPPGPARRSAERRRSPTTATRDQDNQDSSCHMPQDRAPRRRAGGRGRAGVARERAARTHRHRPRPDRGTSRPRAAVPGGPEKPAWDARRPSEKLVKKQSQVKVFPKRHRAGRVTLWGLWHRTPSDAN
jgi:hypothetical protein